MNISDDFPTKVVETLYSKYCKVFRIIDFHGKFISEFPMDINEDLPLDLEEILQYGWMMIDRNMDVRESDMISSLTSNFWTCDCKTKCVRHISDPACKKCGTHIAKSKSRITQFRMENIIGSREPSATYLLLH